MRDAGYASLSVEELVRTRIHGATPAYVRELRDAGYTGLSVDDLVTTRIHGATPEFVKAMKTAGYERLLPVDQLVAMRTDGVSPEFVGREMRDLGLRNLAISDPWRCAFTA